MKHYILQTPKGPIPSRVPGTLGGHRKLKIYGRLGIDLAQGVCRKLTASGKGCNSMDKIRRSPKNKNLVDTYKGPASTLAVGKYFQKDNRLWEVDALVSSDATIDVRCHRWKWPDKVVSYTFGRDEVIRLYDHSITGEFP